MTTHQIHLHSDLSHNEHKDAINSIRETLWNINARNIFRTVVEEVAVEPEDTNVFSYNNHFGQKTQADHIDNRDISIEVVDGLVLAASYAYNRYDFNFALVVKSISLTISDVTYLLDETFALEMYNEDDHSTKTYPKFLEEHSELAETNPNGEDHVTVLLDTLFDFTDIENVWNQ